VILVDNDQILNGSAISVHAWEQDLQADLVKFMVQPDDDVLEIGLGLGMAHAEIQQIAPKSHHVIELSEEVLDFHRSRSTQIFGLIRGDWRQAITTFPDSSFDAIYYDADPENIGAFDGGIKASWDFAGPAVLRRLLRVGGRLGFLDFSCMISKDRKIRETLAEQGYHLDARDISITPPASCYYAPNASCHLIKLTKINI
jgi:ubiquinone/menaquinone biosynthesis C-methylase UbiE